MKKIYIKILTGLVLVAALAPSVQAEESLKALMQRMKANPVAKVAYQETRTLKLLTEAWHGSGFLYSLPPDLMIREQLKPERLLMGVQGNKVFYFDVKNNTRHEGELAADSEQSVPLVVFKAIANADEALLRSVYDIVFAATAQGWTMDLTPKQAAGAVTKIIVSGLSGQAANKVRIVQAEGEYSEFSLQKVADGSANDAAINLLFQELQGE